MVDERGKWALCASFPTATHNHAEIDLTLKVNAAAL
jgi:hypothetical protein